MSDEAYDVTDNPAESRFEVVVDGVTGYLEYKRSKRLLALVHTEVPEAIGGRGIAFVLVRHGFETARQEGRRVVPLCPVAKVFLKRYPEYEELV